MRHVLLCLTLFLFGQAHSHEMTPAYPAFKAYYLPGIQFTTMKLYNRREDVEYYMIDVFDKNWKPIPFAARHRVLKLSYLERVTFDIFVRDESVKEARYICTTSLVSSPSNQTTVVASKICSKVE